MSYYFNFFWTFDISPSPSTCNHLPSTLNQKADSIILGASEYSRIKTDTKPRIGEPFGPIAEFTTGGWAMMSAGKETSLFSRSSAVDSEQLCSLDVLGLEDRPETDQTNLREELIKQFNRSGERWY